MNSFDARKLLRPLSLLLVAAVALYAIIHLWNYYNAAPRTRDGRVKGDVMQVSSDVSGLVTEVLVQDNQTVKRSGLV